jgi:hypothetical protein
MSENVMFDVKKEVLIGLTVLGSALAVTYDVGYFVALDINFFSVFSISEHITFALEIIPLALLLSSLTFLGPMIAHRARERAKLNLQIGKSRPFYKDVSTWVLAGVFLFSIFWWLHRSSYLSLLTAVIIVITEGLMHFMPTSFIRPVVLLAFGTFLAFCIAFTAGVDVASGYRKSDVFQYIVTPTQGPDLKAKVVPSGERGLLFYEGDANHLVVLPWSEIKKVVSSH